MSFSDDLTITTTSYLWGTVDCRNFVLESGVTLYIGRSNGHGNASFSQTSLVADASAPSERQNYPTAPEHAGLCLRCYGTATIRGTIIGSRRGPLGYENNTSKYSQPSCLHDGFLGGGSGACWEGSRLNGYGRRTKNDGSVVTTSGVGQNAVESEIRSYVASRFQTFGGNPYASGFPFYVYGSGGPGTYDRYKRYMSRGGAGLVIVASRVVFEAGSAFESVGKGGDDGLDQRVGQSGNDAGYGNDVGCGGGGGGSLVIIAGSYQRLGSINLSGGAQSYGAHYDDPDSGRAGGAGLEVWIPYTPAGGFLAGF